MARGREAGDWAVDRAAAKETERAVADALRDHYLLTRVDDRSASMETPDFQFTLDGHVARLELKEKHQPLSSAISGLWPDVDEPDLVVVDELSLRRLVWAEGVGYLMIADRPASRWLLFGPWELWLAPRRRYERPGDRGSGQFLKGKLLLDARTAAAASPDLDVDLLVQVVRQARRALSQVEAVELRGRGPLPTVPTVDRSIVRPPRPERSQARSAPPKRATPFAVEGDAPDWCGLSDGIVREIRSRWGWDALTPVQRAAVPAILNEQTTLVLGPTAGGKSEAAMLPLLDRWSLDGWGSGRPSILCLSPLKALLDDQLDRWQRATALVGASAFAWHGDVRPDEKRAFRTDPSDVLLTTPESLELLLSNGDDIRRLAGLRAVVIDEAHAFVGNPRGAQVASLLERLEAILDEDLQRIALSATVSDRGAVVAWLRGRSLRDAGAVDGGRATTGEVVTIRSHEDLDEAADNIGTTRAGRRCLVFAGSRRRVEELALRTGAAAHHSSVAGERRSDALDDLRGGATDMVITSSSLEMGIDVGDLDLVIHVGPPPGPSSYLQRLGRAGRRTGHRAITFLVGEPDDLLLVLATLLRARRNDLEPIDPRRGARLVLGQQALLLTRQRSISTARELYETLRFSPVFADRREDMEATIAHLVSEGYLFRQQDVLVLGPLGQKRYGGRIHELLATFAGTSGAAVVDEAGRPLGEVDWSLVESEDSPVRRDGLVLGGQRWIVTTVDPSMKRVVVTPGGAAMARGWRGTAQPLSRATWAAAREVLSSTDVPSDSDPRAERWLRELREAWAPRLINPIGVSGDVVIAHTFAGEDVHRAVLHALGLEGRTEGPTVELFGSPTEVRSRAAQALTELPRTLDVEAARVAETMPVAHRELCAPGVLLAEAREFEIDAAGIEAVLTMLATWPS